MGLASSSTVVASLVDAAVLACMAWPSTMRCRLWATHRIIGLSATAGVRLGVRAAICGSQGPKMVRSTKTRHHAWGLLASLARRRSMLAVLAVCYLILHIPLARAKRRRLHLRFLCDGSGCTDGCNR